MFTLKFYTHDNESYEVFSCERYSVKGNTIRMYRTIDDENPFQEGFGTLTPLTPYGTVYVMNQEGKTIDTLR